MAEYITEIDFSNQFYAEDIDLATFDFPELQVKTWSNLFGKGGSYAIEPVNGSTFKGRICSVSIEADDSGIRSHMQSLVINWNEDTRTNWLRILHRNFKAIAKYRAEKVADFEKVVAESEKATAQLAAIVALRELAEA